MEEIRREAQRRSILALQALNRMCTGRNCLKSHADPCELRDLAQDLTVDLASNGFTVLEIQCNLGKPLEYIDPSLWEHLCAHCMEYITEQKRQTCKYRKIAETSNQVLRTKGFAIINLYCQYNPLRTNQNFMKI